MFVELKNIRILAPSYILKGKSVACHVIVAGFFYAYTLTICGSVPPCKSVIDLLPLRCKTTGKAEPFFYFSPYINILKMSYTEKNYVAEISVSYSPTYKRKVKITESQTAHKTLRKMWDAQLLNIQEQFCVLFLNNANEVVGFRCLSTGTLTACMLDLKVLFGLACKSLSSGIIIAHNHPSGTTKASQADIDITHKIKRAGDMLDIKLLDHIILTDKTYVSLADRGVI